MLDDRALLRISREWSEARGQGRSGVAATVGALLGVDDVVWLLTDFERRAFASWRGSTQSGDTAVNAIAPQLVHHPAILSYLDEPDDLSPRRLSEVAVPASPLCADSRRLSEQVLGRHQLSLVVQLSPPACGVGWIAVRNGRDFDDDDVATARRLLPLLVVQERLLDAAARRPLPAPSLAEDLTAREAEVVDLLSTGLTAVAIGRLLGISPRTVSKHLEHVYDKLGIHDRLLVGSGIRPAAAGRGRV